MKKGIANLILRIGRIGLGDDELSAFGRTVLLTNLIALLNSIALLLFLLVFAITGNSILVGASAVSIVLLVSGIYLSHKKYFAASKLVVISVSHLIGYIIVVLVGPESSVRIGFMCLIGQSTMLFDFNERTARFLAGGCALLSLGCFIITGFSTPAWAVPLLPASPSALQTFDTLLTTILFAVMFFEFYCLRVPDFGLLIGGDHLQANLVLKSKICKLTDMAENIAHEINNPLAVIYGSASVLKKLVVKSPLDVEKIASCSTTIEKSCERITEIVRRIRTP
jgi:signal transduction histidine kinase